MPLGTKERNRERESKWTGNNFKKDLREGESILWTSPPAFQRLFTVMPNVSLDELKQLLLENCMLKLQPDEIQEDIPLFGPEGLGLDSIDALQITVALEKKYKATIPNPEVARQVLQNLGSLREWLIRQ